MSSIFSKEHIMSESVMTKLLLVGACMLLFYLAAKLTPDGLNRWVTAKLAGQ